MKGYDACVFPREGEPVLITIEASEEDAARTAWTEDVRLIRGYDPEDPRPPLARTLDAAVEAARDYERVGLELSLGTQASDRMVGEPTTFTAAWFDAFAEAADATPLLVRARSRQDRAGARAAAAGERDRRGGDGARPRAAPPGDEGGAGGRALAGLRARRGHGLDTARSSSRSRSRSCGPGRGIKTFTATGRPARGRGRARPVRDLGLRRRLLGRPHEEPRGGRAEAASTPSSKTALMDVYDSALEHIRPGAPMAELDRQVRGQLHDAGLRGPADASDLPRRRCAGARAAVSPPGRRRRVRGGDGARGRAGRLLGRRRRAPRRGQLPGHERRRREALVVPGRGGADVRPDLDRLAERPLRDPRRGRPVRHDAARRRADGRRRPLARGEARDRAAARRARDRADRGGLPARVGGRPAGRRADRRRRAERGGLGLLARRARPTSSCWWSLASRPR